MPSLLDLIPLGEEVHCTAVLAMLLELDKSGELLLGILRRARAVRTAEGDSGLRPGAPSSMANWPLDGSVEDLRLTTEEWFELEGQEGRFDLVARFSLDGTPCVVVLEVKVQAAGEHGSQLDHYQRQIERWEAASKSDDRPCRYALLLLTLRSVEESTWNTDLRRLSHLSGSIRWSDVLDELAGICDRRQLAPEHSFATLGSALRERIEELTMTARDYQPLMKAAHYPYPLLVDAFAAVAREVAGEARLYTEPRGTGGAAWDRGEERYWCGYWWRLGGEQGGWASLRMEWSWRKERPAGAREWIPDASRSGYAFEIGLRIGNEDKPTLAWSEDEFVAKLGSIVDPQCQGSCRLIPAPAAPPTSKQWG